MRKDKLGGLASLKVIEAFATYDNGGRELHQKLVDDKEPVEVGACKLHPSNGKDHHVLEGPDDDVEFWVNAANEVCKQETAHLPLLDRRYIVRPDGEGDLWVVMTAREIRDHT